MRHGLLQRLRDAAPVTLVTAPAGFGKSTLLAQWFHDIRLHSSRHTAWISLDEDDREVTRFVAHLILATAHAGLPLGELESAARVQLRETDLDSALAELIGRIREAPAGLILFLDDFQRANSPGVLASVDTLMRAVGDRLALVVAGRESHGLRVAHLAARGMMTRFEAFDLAMSESESAALVGDQVSAEDMRHLHERTEGWPVALQLARLLRGRADGRPFDLRGFSGRQSEVAAYLTEQVLGDFASELRDFLLDTSVLERFDVALADAVRGRDDSASLLARLAHLDALLVPVDATRQSFRYHHLFAEYLQQTLSHERRHDLATFHRRAALWWSARRELPIAVRHAVKSGDVGLATQLFVDAGGWELVLYRGLGFTRGILRQFGIDTIEATPALLLAEAYLAMKCGESPRARSLLASALLDRDKDVVVARGRLVLSALLRIYADDIANGGWLPHCERDCGRLQADDALGRGALLTTGAVVALSHQQFEIAERLSLQSIDALQQLGSELLTIHGRLHRARSYFARGRLREARTAYGEALAIAAENVSVEPAGHTWARCFLAQIAFWQGDVDVAHQHLHGILDRLHGHDSYHDIYLCAFDTMWRIDASSGDFGAARKTIELAEATARRRHFPRIVELVPSWFVLLHVQRGDLVSAQRLARDHGLARMVAAGLEHPYHWRTAFEAAMALGRLDIASKRSAAAARRWQPLMDRAGAYGMTFEVAQLELMMARVELARGDRPAAAALLAPVVAYAMREDARGLLSWEGATIANLMREVSQDDGDAAWDATAKAFMMAPAPARRQQGHGLSARETEVLLHACRGHSNKAISLSLMLSENTVKYHLKNVFRKLDVDSRLQAVDVARRWRLVDDAPSAETEVHELSGDDED